jgi:spore coat protein U-like protein
VALEAASVSYEIELGPGGGGTYAMREMTSASGTLDYQLYTDASRTTIWGDGTGGTVTTGFNGQLAAGTTTHSYPVHGAIPARQNVAAGSYSDVITVTLNY